MSVPFDVVQSTGVCLAVVSVGSVEYALFGRELVRSGWPIAKSAGAAFAAGIEFQHQNPVIYRDP